jgi:hypothetical protein
MGFIRRLLGGKAAPDEPATADAPIDAAAADADEREHELDLLRDEQGRLDDLAQRQIRYADYAWTPPRRGGERRADDADERR